MAVDDAVLQVIELEDVNEPIDSNVQTIDIHALVQKVKKPAVHLLLRRKFEVDMNERNSTVKSLAHEIQQQDSRESIVTDLFRVASCCREGERDTFYTLCRTENISVEFNDSFAVMAVKCLIESPEHFERVQWASAVNRVHDKEVFSGKTDGEPIEITEERLETIARTIAEMIEETEPGRKYEVSTAIVEQKVLFTSYFSEPTRTVTTFSKSDRITTIHLTPASKVLAEYDVQTNRLFIRAGRSEKLKRYVLESFGKVFYGDNTHFTNPKNQAYQLDKLMEEGFVIPEVLPVSVRDAKITEETLAFPYGEQELVMTIKTGDVEKALADLSHDGLNFSTQRRVAITLELLIEEAEDKVKKVTIKITDRKKITYDPRYSIIVHQCLADWGIHIAISEG